MIYQGPIKLLRELRILHIYRDRMIRVVSSQCRNNANVTLDAHRLAILLFRQMHHYCPKLKVLVLGIYGEPTPTEVEIAVSDACDEGLVIERHSQYIYVKRERTDDDGNVHITAVPTSRRRVQDAFQDLDIMAHDPGFEHLERFVNL